MTTIREYINKFGNALTVGVTVVISLFVLVQTLHVYDAARYPYMFFSIIAFVAGTVLPSNRWVMKLVSIIALILVSLIAGNEPDVKQVFVFLPYMLGVLSQFVVGLRINLLDSKGEGAHAEDH